MAERVLERTIALTFAVVLVGVLITILIWFLERQKLTLTHLGSGTFKTSPTANHIYYRKYNASTGLWEPAYDWLDESAEVLTDNDRLTTFYNMLAGYLGLAYRTKTASPYNVKYAIAVAPPPPPVVAVPRYIGNGLAGVVVII